MTLWFLSWWAANHEMWEAGSDNEDLRPVEYEVFRRLQLQAMKAELLRFGFRYKAHYG